MDRRSFIAALSAFTAGVTLPGGTAWADGPVTSTFHRIYDDVGLRDQFFLFLQNIFHLYPEDDFHQLIVDLVAANPDDPTIYRELHAALPKIKTIGGDLTYALPALKKQKREMARQSTRFLKGVAVDGYLEIGSTGRYVSWLAKKLDLKGPTFVCNDIAPTYGPVDVLERGQVAQVGTFLPLGNYDPLDPGVIADASLDLVSSFIGLHHCPLDRLEGFVTSVRRVLRPGGTLLLREHDVADDTMDAFVALAHDVFNAGVGITWEDNREQVRHFRSVNDWQSTLTAWGFAPAPGAEVQAHDPTDNTLLAFTVV